MHRPVIVIFGLIMIVPMAVMFYFGLQPGRERAEIVLPDTPIADSRSAAAGQLLPIDEANRNAELSRLRDTLLAAAKDRDIETIIGAAAENISLSFGGDVGRERFRQLLDENADTGGVTYWQELETALALGGVFVDDTSYCTPYVACLELACGDVPCEPFDTFVAIGEAIPVYAAPSNTSNVVATLNYDIVTPAAAYDNDSVHHAPWIEIRLSSSKTGFVHRSGLRAPTDYRMWIERNNGEWQITTFIAGD